MSLSVAIPTMDRYEKFLKKQLPLYLNDSSIENVVICDENGNDISSIASSDLGMNPKLRLYQNDRTLGVYGNKRQCLLNSSTDYVAVLDSDNTFGSSFFTEFLRVKERDGESAKKIIYCAGKNNRLNIESGEIEDCTAHFSGMKITKENWNKILQIKNWNFLLNDGNSIWPRDVIQHFPDIPEDQIVGTDSVFFMRQAILAGYTLSVEPTMSYIHTVHDGSHWLQNAEVSSRLMRMRDWRV